MRCSTVYLHTPSNNITFRVDDPYGAPKYIISNIVIDSMTSDFIELRLFINVSPDKDMEIRILHKGAYTIVY